MKIFIDSKIQLFFPSHILFSQKWDSEVIRDQQSVKYLYREKESLETECHLFLFLFLHEVEREMGIEPVIEQILQLTLLHYIVAWSKENNLVASNCIACSISLHNVITLIEIKM